MNIPINQEHSEPPKLRSVPDHHETQPRPYINQQPQFVNVNQNRPIIHPYPIVNQVRTMLPTNSPISVQYPQQNPPMNKIHFQIPHYFEPKIIHPNQEVRIRQPVNIHPFPPPPSHNVSGVQTTQIVTPQFFSPHQKQLNPI